MADKPKQVNRIKVNLISAELEVESSTESLDKVFIVADTIARHLGTHGLTKKEISKKLQSHGIH